MTNLELELNFKKTAKPFSRWRVFAFTFAIVFLLTIVQYLIPKNLNENFLNSNTSKNSILNNVYKRIENKTNIFKLNEPLSLVSSSFASSYDFDNSNAYVAIDYNTGNVLLEKNMSKKFSIASLTKLMTAVVSLDLAKPNDNILISKKASQEEPTTIGVVAGQKMTVKELLNAALLTSANDAAEALRDGINQKYGSNIFVDAMNKKAKFLKLNNTNFSNPQGFDNPNNYSSAEDLAILTHYALENYPLIRDIVKKDYQFIPATNNHKQFDLYNWNGLLDVYPGVEGVKIGNTDNAGYTSIVLSERNNKKVLVVLLGAPGIIKRDIWASEILDASFEKLSQLPSAQITENDLRQKYSTWKYWN